MKVQKTIDIQLIKKRLPRPIDVVQYDTGIQLVFNMLDFGTPNGTTATLYVQKPSGRFVYQEDGITVAGSTITVDLHNQALTEHGDNIPYQVQLKNGADLITTFSGIMRVEKSLADSGAVESVTVLAAFAEVTAEKIAEIKAACQVEISALQQESARQQANVAAKGELTLATIPDDYTATYNMAKQAMDEKAPAIVCEATGEIITVADASDAPVRGLKLFGKTTQVKTTGENLLPNTATGKTENGVTIMVNDDGGISFSGSATGYAGIPLYEGNISVFPNLITIFALGTFSNVVLHIVLMDKSGSTLLETNLTSATPHRTIDFSQYENSDRITINAKRYTTGVVLGTVYPMVVSGKVDSVEFEPYSGGKPAPSPEYPQELVNVGAGGSIGVKAMGKNLLGDNRGLIARTDHGVTFTPVFNVDGTLNYINVNGTATGGRADYYCTTAQSYSIPLPKGAVATLSGGTESIELFIQSSNYQQAFRSAGNSPTQELLYDTYGCWLQIQEGKAVNNAKIRPQLEVGAAATAYEPYKAIQTLTTFTPNGLPGIPVTSGGNYTDASGKQWVCDEIDFERGVHVQRIGQDVLTGSENMAAYPMQDGGNTRIQVTIDGPDKATSYDKDVVTHSTHFNGSKASWEGMPVNSVQYYQTIGAYVLAGTVTVDDAKAFFAGQYNNGTPVITHYILATPIETPLSADEIAAFKAMHTCKPNTTVINDAGAGMKLDYNADTKIYIDNKFAELAKAVLNNV